MVSISASLRKFPAAFLLLISEERTAVRMPVRLPLSVNNYVIIPSGILLDHVCRHEEFDTKFQAIWLAAWHFLTHAVPQVQPQFVAFSSAVIHQTEVIGLHYSQHVAHLQQTKHTNT